MKDEELKIDYTALAQEIVKRMFEPQNQGHRKFVQELHEKYKELKASKDGKYTQDWPAYNRAQMKEKILLMKILNELLGYIPFPSQKKVGRKPVLTRDKIFYLVMQSYNMKSSRRCISDLHIAKESGYIQKAPHFNTILKCLNDPSITDYLQHLISVAGIPLQQIEQDFAVDSSGFSTSRFDRWFDVRFDPDKHKEIRKFRKCHITCGVMTNIITAVNITNGYNADSPEFINLIRQTDKIYDIREVSADKAYSSRNNLQAVSDIGGIPFIPFKSNVPSTTLSKGAPIWKKMYRFFTEYSDQFYYHYHKRSNSETCFHMIKQKFGSHLRSKSETGQTNEILAKCLCHNICVLIQEALEIGIELDFKKCAEIPFARNY